MNKKIVVPEGMFKAADKAASTPILYGSGNSAIRTVNWVHVALEAALRWLSENPIVPDHAQAIHLCETFEAQRPKPDYCDSVRQVAIEWQRRMFLAPEPRVPEEVRILLRNPGEDGTSVDGAKRVNAAIIEAFRRGQKASH